MDKDAGYIHTHINTHTQTHTHTHTHTHTQGILLSHKKEWNAISHNMDGPKITILSKTEKDTYNMV